MDYLLSLVVIHILMSRVSLFIVEIDNVIEMVSVQNGLFCGLCLVNAFDVLIANSTFANNEGSVSIH